MVVLSVKCLFLVEPTFVTGSSEGHMTLSCLFVLHLNEIIGLDLPDNLPVEYLKTIYSGLIFMKYTALCKKLK